ncbi:MAG TPA: M23 family metallopeptidase [Acidimicrobiales bacterium]|nr:M23 family metallopeptidase [Acidimicrobiales bacterium]
MGRGSAGNHHAVASDQRYAFDFLIWRDGSTHRGDGADNADYWAWAQPVLSPADGTVVSVHDGVADNRPGAQTNTTQPAGNHVVIDLGRGEYAALAHFRAGSIRVAEGERVSSGQVLGLVGNSGNSSEPHIHFHLQDSPRFNPGGPLGIPVRFEDYEADGRAQDRGMPSAGQFVRTIRSAA